MTNNSETELGNWIKVGLDDAGKNQEWLANKLNTSPGHVSRIISSGTATCEMLASIADALGKPRSQAFRAAGFIEPVTPLEKDVEEIVKALGTFTPMERQELLAYVNLVRNLRNKRR